MFRVGQKVRYEIMGGCSGLGTIERFDAEKKMYTINVIGRIAKEVPQLDCRENELSAWAH